MTNWVTKGMWRQKYQRRWNGKWACTFISSFSFIHLLWVSGVRQALSSGTGSLLSSFTISLKYPVIAKGNTQEWLSGGPFPETWSRWPWLPLSRIPRWGLSNIPDGRICPSQQSTHESAPCSLLTGRILVTGLWDVSPCQKPIPGLGWAGPGPSWSGGFEGPWRQVHHYKDLTLVMLTTGTVNYMRGTKEYFILGDSGFLLHIFFSFFLHLLSSAKVEKCGGRGWNPGGYRWTKWKCMSNGVTL